MSNCTKCHELANVTNTKCMDCHSEIKKMVSHKGYHSAGSVKGKIVSTAIVNITAEILKL
jgi:hypothetical protein